MSNTILSDVKIEDFNLDKLDPKEFTNLVLIGPTKSGKTTKVQKIIEHVKKWYQAILLISETADINGMYNNLVSPVCIFTDFSQVRIDKIKTVQTNYKQNNPKGPPRRILMIFDDVMKNVDALKKNDDFKNLFYAGRHYDIYVIYSAHFLYAVPKSIRNAVGILVILTLSAPSDISIMYDSYWDIGFSEDKNSCKEFITLMTQDKAAVVIDNTNRSTKDIRKRCFRFSVSNEDAERYKNGKFMINEPTLTRRLTKIFYDNEWQKREKEKKIVKKGKGKIVLV